MWYITDKENKILAVSPEKFSDDAIETDKEIIYDEFMQLRFKDELPSDYKEKLKKKKQEEALSSQYIPSESASIKALFRSISKTQELNDETKLSVSGLYDTWKTGKYEVGDIRNYAGQTWECIQAHDNSVYPDITPDNPQTWHTFWKPLHGKSAATARPWVKPQFGTTDMYLAGEYMIYTDGKKQFGTTDMYLAGEYMIYTDGKRYKCLSDTVYSPEEYAQAWEVQE